jgi:hypothetical protein
MNIEDVVLPPFTANETIRLLGGDDELGEWRVVVSGLRNTESFSEVSPEGDAKLSYP